MRTLTKLLVGTGALAGTMVAGTALVARGVKRAVPPQGRFLHLSGRTVHTLDEGEGPPLVLVHGLGGQIGNFSHSLVERLARDFRVIAIDRTGSGYSSRQSADDARLPRQAALVAEVIEALRLDRPLVVGHSLGGAVALQLAADRPDLVSGLALIAPATQPQEELPEAFRALTIASPVARAALAWTLITPLSVAARDRTLALVFGPETPPDDFGRAGGGYLGLRPSAFLAASDDLHALRDDMPALAGRYGSIEVPVGILYGREDAILDAEVHGSRAAEQLPTAELTLIAGGHMLPLTQPDATADFIRATHARMATA